MRLLIVEDNIELVNMMRDYMIEAGYLVDVATTGLMGEEKALVNEYDVILLDLNLPEKDGIKVLRYLREEGMITPVIIVSARDEIEDRIIGLNLGADDYLVKPFQLSELKARVNAIIRRAHGRSNPHIVIEQLTVIPLDRMILWDGKAIELTVKEYDIVQYLAMNHPMIISAEQLVEHVYDETFDPFSSVIRVHVARLRKKLIEACGSDILLTTRGKGYSLWIEQNLGSKPQK